MYQPKKPARSEFVRIRNLDYHVLQWGQPAPGKVPLFLVHGWMDVAASWQFAVDEMPGDPWVIAPDWRGYGLTQSPPADNYWFPDYLADLDFLIDHYSPESPIDLAGHSMGGNVVMLYAGSRPARIRRLVNFEGFGLAATQASMAPKRYAKWMDDLKALHRGDLDLRSYESADGVAARLMKTTPRLSRDKADWLAQRWARPDEPGRWRILGAPAHKIVNANLYRVDEVLELYRCISAPVLAVEASDDSLTQWWKGKFTLDEYHERLKSVPDCRVARVDDAGHMLHHDQPSRVAQLLAEFLS